MDRHYFQYFWIVAFLLVLGNFYVWQFVFSLDNALEVVFFDVGQGDSVFIRTPQDHQILIDGGPNGKLLLEKLGKTMPFWDNSLDLVILTHADYDHLRGLTDVLARYNVENVLWTGAGKNSETFVNWVSGLGNEKAKITIAQKGQVIKAGLANIFVLYPFNSLEGQIIEEESNDSSIVAKLNFGSNNFLFLGDISQAIERIIFLGGDLVNSLDIDVLKVAHHGSKYASSKDFLRAAQPKIAVITAGKDNQYGHPHQETLQKFAEFGINVLRTDEMGDIEIVFNGRETFINN